MSISVSLSRHAHVLSHLLLAPLQLNVFATHLSIIPVDIWRTGKYEELALSRTEKTISGELILQMLLFYFISLQICTV